MNAANPDIRSKVRRRVSANHSVTRVTVIIHRYVALAVGLLMTLWCVSGFVMMYQSYPALTNAERLQGLATLDLGACCKLEGLDLGAAGTSPAFRIEMLNGNPVLRRTTGTRGRGAAPEVWNLASGAHLEPLTRDGIKRVGHEYATRHGITGALELVGPVAMDQWTVQSARRNQPAYKITFQDPAATEIYVSGKSGEVFQDTNRRERVLAWFGAIPHWLYPLELRRDGALWAQVVIWTSVIGTLLTATGMYLGVVRWLRARQRGRVSPFRGWWGWHHITGLVFGILTLAWVFSGLLTMNPWNALSRTGPNYAPELRGHFSARETTRFLSAIGRNPGDGEILQLRSLAFDNRLYVLATGRDGSQTLLDADAQPVVLSRDSVKTAVAQLGTPVREFKLLANEDSFYYSQQAGEADLPVYRVILDDVEQTRLYINPLSGQVRSVGANGRLSRWVRVGLHDFDFAWMRARPLWDAVVLLLLAGVTLVCATGTWLAWKRVRLDLRRLGRWRRKSARRAAG